MQVNKIHIELTTKCNAKCWEFLNPDSKVCLHGRARNKDIHSPSLKHFLNDVVLSKITEVKLCGSFGEPTLHYDFLGIVEHIKDYPNIKISLSTNGDTHNPSWWYTLGSILNKKDVVYFGIDGLEDTLPLYRGTSFQRIMKNLKSFKSFSKARSEWQYIVFKHNEHQIEEAQKIANNLEIDLDLRESGEYNNNLIRPSFTKFTEANISETHSFKEGYLFIGADGYIFPGHFTRLFSKEICDEVPKPRLDSATYFYLLKNLKELHISNSFEKVVDILEEYFEDRVL